MYVYMHRHRGVSCGYLELGRFGASLPQSCLYVRRPASPACTQRPAQSVSGLPRIREPAERERERERGRSVLDVTTPFPCCTSTVGTTEKFMQGTNVPRYPIHGYDPALHCWLTQQRTSPYSTHVGGGGWGGTLEAGLNFRHALQGRLTRSIPPQQLSKGPIEMAHACGAE